MSILIQTSYGDITVDLWVDKCPKTTENFIKLCKIKHYNNALFSEVQKNYLTKVTTKNPTTIWQCLTGNRNDSHFNDEVDHQLKFNQIGYLATANKGPNQNNSQFFITLTKAHLSSLNGKHTIFGKVQQGLDILRKINDTFCDKHNRPQMNIRILHTYILSDPFQDPAGLVQPSSPQLQRDPVRLQAIQHLEMLQKFQKQEDINQTIRKQKAKKQAVTLQMLGDLPDANIKPPQNILFVCKLNLITQQRDLQIIFSRFGPIKSVQLVRDWKTGQSLQYAFIQFQTPKACQQAYLKMNNVLIDDRRIQVDFSQSVSKFMPRNKRKQQNQKRMVKQTQSSQLKQKIVRVSTRKVEDDNKYGLITNKPRYDQIVRAQTSKYRQRQPQQQNKHVSEDRIKNNRQQNQTKHRKYERQSSESSSSSQRSLQKKKKKQKKKKQKKQRSRERQRQRSRSVQHRKKRHHSSQSQRSRHQSKKKKQKGDKKQKKDKKQRKQKKQKKQKKKKHQSYSDSQSN